MQAADERLLACMSGPQRLEALSEVGTILPRSDIPKIHEQLHRPVVILRLLGCDEALDLCPEHGLIASQLVEALRSGARRGALALVFLLRSLLGGDAPSLVSNLFARVKKLRDSPQLGHGVAG